MSLKWTGNQSETGILRKSECKEKKEELFVFGYSCKLFREDVKALQIDQGKHLIPWMGDETLKIDRYDARGALHDLSALEAPPGGFDWRVELTRTELDVEQLCDEERYRALHTDEDEEEMYKEEELKRLHAAGYGQVGFNYDTPAESTPEVPVEVEEPFEPSQALKDLLPANTVFPDSQKQNAIIEKTANFIAHQGTQMEILIKAKQRDNPQFKFLNKDNVLHAYYTALTALVKAGKWPEKAVEVVEEKHDMNEEYLHPSLAATVIESAPSIPSIHYKPSADCDYTLLISKMRGEATLDEAYTTELAPGEVAPPGTEPLPPRANAEISRAPVMYNNKDQATPPVVQQQYAALYQQYTHTQTPANTQTHTQASNTPPPPPQIDQKPTATKSTGLSLMKNYNTDSDSDVSDFDDSSSSDSKDNIVITPPEDVKTVIDKMAAYVARNGDEFEEIVRSKNDPRFTFLEPDNLYHPFYKRLMQEKRGVDVNGKDKEQPKQDKTAPMVSFSIKKHKEPDPILPKPALPYESSSEDDETKTETNEEAKEPPKTNIPQITATNNIPPVLVYKMEVGQINNLPVVTTIEQRVTSKTARAITIPEIKEQVKEPIREEPKPEEHIQRDEEIKTEKSPEKRDEKIRDREKKSPSKRKHHERKKEYRSKEHRERRTERRSADREKERERKRDRESEKKRKKYKDELESEIISLEDNSDEMIDLTGDQSDSKGEYETEADKTKQQERRRRAAEFLKKVGVDPAAAALPHTSLASAMVDTLESLRKKKNEQEEKRRRHEKRRRKEKREYEGELDKHRKSKRKKNRSSEEDSDYESSKKKKRRKDRKPSKNKKKRRQEIELEEEDPPPQIHIDLTNTLKELRTLSPTEELGLQGIDDPPTFPQQDSSSEEEIERKKRKKDREYSEGEWSSDTDEDSVSSADRE